MSGFCKSSHTFIIAAMEDFHGGKFINQEYLFLNFAGRAAPIPYFTDTSSTSSVSETDTWKHLEMG